MTHGGVDIFRLFDRVMGMDEAARVGRVHPPVTQNRLSILHLFGRTLLFGGKTWLLDRLVRLCRYI